MNTLKKNKRQIDPQARVLSIVSSNKSNLNQECMLSKCSVFFVQAPRLFCNRYPLLQ